MQFIIWNCWTPVWPTLMFLIETVIWSSGCSAASNYYLARWCWKTTITLLYFSYLEYWILKLLKSNTKITTLDKKVYHQVKNNSTWNQGDNSSLFNIATEIEEAHTRSTNFSLVTAWELKVGKNCYWGLTFRVKYRVTQIKIYFFN